MNPTTKSWIHHVTTLSIGCKLSIILTENIHTQGLYFEQPHCTLCLLAVVTKMPGLPSGFKMDFTHSRGENWGGSCGVTWPAISYIVLSDLSHQSYQSQKLYHFFGCNVQPVQCPRQYLQLLRILSLLKTWLLSNNYARSSPINVLVTPIRLWITAYTKSHQCHNYLAYYIHNLLYLLSSLVKTGGQSCSSLSDLTVVMFCSKFLFHNHHQTHLKRYPHITTLKKIIKYYKKKHNSPNVQTIA